MIDSTTSLIFIILAFCLGAVLIMMRNSIPDRLRRPLAIITIVFVAFAFFLIVYSTFTVGGASG